MFYATSKHISCVKVQNFSKTISWNYNLSYYHLNNIGTIKKWNLSEKCSFKYLKQEEM